VLSDTEGDVRQRAYRVHGAGFEVHVPAEEPEHLSRLQTLWTLVCQAHQGPEAQGREARAALLDRYGGAARRYLLGALRDGDAADELAQEFALKFLRGEFRNANPERGRFRNFLKTVLVRLVIDFHRRRKRQPLGMNSQVPEPVAPDDPPFDSDAVFLQSWRNELLARGWAALERFEKSAGQVFYTVLRFRADHPDFSSAQMAERLSAELGKQFSAANVRQLLHRSREKFAELLLDEVSETLEQQTSLTEELIELSLLDYCRPALERRNLT
jgi:RNA polymerase sigma-70 factor (ECF subfamily)